MNKIKYTIHTILAIPLTNTSLFTGLVALSKVLEQYWYYEIKAIMGVFLLVLADTLTGIAVAVKNKEFTSKRFGGVTEKLLVYISLLLVGVVIKSVDVGIEMEIEKDIAFHAIYAAIVIRETSSVFENASKLGIIKLPDWFKNDKNNTGNQS